MTLGQIITYKDDNGVEYAAIVVKANEDSTVNLQVFMDANSMKYVNGYSELTNTEGGNN